MSDFVMVKLPKRVFERLEKMAQDEWSDEDRDEYYNDSVTCGNADDTYADGETQGAAQVASEVLAYVVKE